MKRVWYLLGGLVVLIAIWVIGQLMVMGPIKEMRIVDVDLSRIADGVHEGAFKQSRWDFLVAVTVTDHKIVAVKMLSPRNPVTDRLLSTEAEKVIAAQSPNVDTVSGATVTSKAMLKAIENALTK